MAIPTLFPTSVLAARTVRSSVPGLSVLGGVAVLWLGGEGGLRATDDGVGFLLVAAAGVLGAGICVLT